VAWHLYVIRTVDQKLYAGVTTDVQRRFKEHLRQGHRAARYLRAHKPQRLVFSQEIGSRSLVLKVEHWFKRLPRQRKERIVRSGRLNSGEGYTQERFPWR
jgi:putative endonuclease